MGGTPPVTVMSIPTPVGARGYGAKLDQETGRILIPFNSTSNVLFSDIPDRKILIMARARFNDLPLWDKQDQARSSCASPGPPVSSPYFVEYSSGYSPILGLYK